MTSKAIAALMLCLLIGILTAGGFALYYRGNAIDYKAQHDKATGDLKLAKATIDDMTVRQRAVADLDAKYTKELSDANTENDRLRARLVNGSRVRVSGECKASAGSVGDAGTIELSSGAGSNVLNIRAGIIKRSGQSEISAAVHQRAMS